jgi:hypothetical protein
MNPLVTFDFSHRDVSNAGLNFLHDQQDVEVCTGWCCQSFGTDILPGMYSTPGGVVPKPHSYKFCLMNDLSAGLHALNSWIAKDDSSVCFDNLQDFGSILCDAHKQCKEPPAWAFQG